MKQTLPLLPTYQNLVHDSLLRLKKKYTNYEKVITSDLAPIEYLFDMSMAGKYIRSSLFLAASGFGSETIEKEKISSIAVALELFQSSFLIHDDIIDHDDIRRGKPSAYKHFQDISSKKGINDPHEIGTHVAMCAADVGFFIGMSLIAESDIDVSIKQRIMSLISKEYAQVGLAELDEVFQSASGKLLDDVTILSIYTHKTARYTFSLPLMMGAIVSGSDKKTIDILSSLGEYMGIVFQIVDDELSLFGEIKKTGKPLGGDLRERKQTFFYTSLHKHGTAEEHEIVSQAASFHEEKDMLKALAIMKKPHIYNPVKTLKESYIQKAQEKIHDLSLDRNHITVLSDLLAFVITRTS